MHGNIAAHTAPSQSHVIHRKTRQSPSGIMLLELMESVYPANDVRFAHGLGDQDL